MFFCMVWSYHDPDFGYRLRRDVTGLIRYIHMCLACPKRAHPRPYGCRSYPLSCSLRCAELCRKLRRKKNVLTEKYIQ